MGSLGQNVITTRVPDRIRGSINSDLIAAKLKDINVSMELEWAETFIISEQVLPIVSVDDDFAREAAL